MIRYEGNCTTTVVKQGKYRLVHDSGHFVVQVVIETSEGTRLYPASREHPELAKLVNAVKTAHGGGDGGQFYINEYRQVIVPAGDPVEYYFAGEYAPDIVLKLDNAEFCGRPHDDKGNLLTPGDSWVGRPRPGLKYTLKAGGTDIEYTRETSPGRERVVRLSKIVGPQAARRTARKIAAIRGNAGGPFYVNEYRALFGPQAQEDGWTYVFIGTLTDEDPWFPKWEPPSQTSPVPATRDLSKIVALPSQATERTLEITDDAKGYSYDYLFADYLRNAEVVDVHDPYVMRPHQVANFLRLCELTVRLGTIKQIQLVTSTLPNDASARLESVRRSLLGFGVRLELRQDPKLHDRCIRTNHGWEIHLGRGLDIYKKPDDFCTVGATDFCLRPCHKTTIVYKRTPVAKVA